MFRIRWFLSGVLGTLAVFFAGCGGQTGATSFGGTTSGTINPTGQRYAQGGSSSGASNQNSSQGIIFTVFLTDSSNSLFESSWVKFYEVQVQTSTSSIPIFQSSEGRSIDLNTLRDEKGARFAFLGACNLGTGPLVRIQAIVDKTFYVMTKDSRSKELTAKQFPSELDGDKGKTRVLLNLNLRDLSSTPKQVVLNFGLADLIAENKQPKAFQQAIIDGLEDFSRHETMAYSGRIEGLSGISPAVQFKLNQGSERSFRVVAGAQSLVLNGGDVKSKLENGAQVIVRGIYSVAQGALMATSMDLAKKPNSAVIMGQASEEEGGKAILLQPKTIDGFSPKTLALKIDLSKIALWVNDKGNVSTKEEFLKALGTKPSLVAEGNYDTKQSVFVPLKIRWEAADPFSVKPVIPKPSSSK